MPLYPSAGNFIRARPWLLKIWKPWSEFYRSRAGYRQLGLFADDLYEEEKEVVKLALERLTPKESYDRIYRIRRAVQVNLQQKELPREQWTKPEEDQAYLTPLIEQILLEQKEKLDLDNLELAKDR